MTTYTEDGWIEYCHAHNRYQCRQCACVWDVREGSAKKARQCWYLPGSFSHPAKMSIGLARRILETYTRPGDVVLDPMCGIGTTLVEATRLGRLAVGVELEQRFVDLANCNATHAEWRMRLLYPPIGKPHGTGCGTCFQGDARDLMGILGEDVPAVAVLSPPWGDTNHPMGQVAPSVAKKYVHDCAYSDNESNIGNLPFHVAVLSPPFADQNSQPTKLGNGKGRRGGGGADRVKGDYDYAASPGQIGTCIFSPPFGEANRGGQPAYLVDKALPGAKPGHFSNGKHLQVSQVATNIDNLKKDTYLEAMAAVYVSVHSVLQPSGVMVLVTKDFVRDGARVPLGRYTVELCQRAGFTFRPCLTCQDEAFPHTHKCPLRNPSFWIHNQIRKWNEKHPGCEAKNPYALHEDVLVFQK